MRVSQRSEFTFRKIEIEAGVTTTLQLKGCQFIAGRSALWKTADAPCSVTTSSRAASRCRLAGGATPFPYGRDVRSLGHAAQ